MCVSLGIGQCIDKQKYILEDDLFVTNPRLSNANPLDLLENLPYARLQQRSPKSPFAPVQRIYRRYTGKCSFGSISPSQSSSLLLVVGL
jgi:hypothetical protein